MTARRATRGSSAPAVLGAVAVLALALGAAWWLLADDTPSAPTPDAAATPEHSAPPAAQGAPRDAAPLVAPEPSPSSPEPLSEALSGRLAWPDAVRHLSRVADALAASEAETSPLRDGGRRLAATLPDGRAVVATHTQADPTRPARDRIPKTLPWDEALEQLPDTNTDRGALDTLTLTITPPALADLPAPWTDAPPAGSERLTITRREGALAGHAEFVVAPLASRALAAGLMDLSPPGSARTGLRFEWDRPDVVRVRDVWARVDAPDTQRVDVYSPSETARAAVADAAGLEALAARLEALLTDG